MIGAICGDVLGAYYEYRGNKEFVDTEELLLNAKEFTDDSVMTIAVAQGIIKAMKNPYYCFDNIFENREIIINYIEKEVVFYGKKYMDVGYGENFINYLSDENRKPYYSWGNGSAMRCSFCGWAAKTAKEALFLAECSAEITHNHPEGIKGAKAVAGSIYFLRHGATKEEIKRFVSMFYNMEFSLDEIRKDYSYDVSCQGTVPQAIKAFLEGNSFEEVISNAISIGGDADTVAAIAGSLAEVIYDIPKKIKSKVYTILDDYLKISVRDINIYLEKLK